MMNPSVRDTDRAPQSDTTQVRTRVKICGITRQADAHQIAMLGGDAIGLVFHKASPRSIDLDTALRIRKAIPPFVCITALFMDEEESWIKQVIDRIEPDCLQFHGQESAQFCGRWSRPYIKVIPMASVNDAEAYARQFPQAQGFLMDSHAAGCQGGSGDTFDWSTIPPSFGFPLILAGGLDPTNVASAIIQTRPWGVDVSSGVEVSRGIKDVRLIKQFFREVSRGDSDA